MISIVVPAHNEEHTLPQCLDAMLDGHEPGELEVLVVANGCTDRTAEVARSYGSPVRLLECPLASKSEALNLGDRAAAGFPRFFVDADVVMRLESIRRVSDCLRKGEALAAAPRLSVDLSQSSWAVRAYYTIWTRLPYHREGMIGSGVYALSKEGRARFARFPDIISDDGFVRLHFRSTERHSVRDAEFRIRAPRRLRDVLAVKTRSQKGWVQLRRAHPALLENETRSYASAFDEIARAPALWLPALVYAYVIARTKLRAYWMNYVGELGDWERDDSSRTTPLQRDDASRDASDPERVGSPTGPGSVDGHQLPRAATETNSTSRGPIR